MADGLPKSEPSPTGDDWEIMKTGVARNAMPVFQFLRPALLRMLAANRQLDLRIALASNSSDTVSG